MQLISVFLLFVHFKRYHLLTPFLVYVLSVHVRTVCVYFFYIFAFHLINLDGLFVYDVAHPSKSIYTYIGMESVKIDSSFHISLCMMAIFLLLCWTSNDCRFVMIWPNCCRFTDHTIPLLTWLKSAAFIFFKNIFARPFFISQKELRRTHTQSQSAIGYNTNLDWKTQEQRNSNGEMNWIEYENVK